jgi:hypothetical protein
MFMLAVCAEMIFRDLPIEARARRIAELGFQVEIWDWTRHDIGALERTGATFSSMTGYVTDDLIDPDGADELLRTAAGSIPVAAVLADPSLQAVLIASSTDTHVDLLARSAKAAKAVLCEEPIDLDIAKVEACRHLRRLRSRGHS